MTEKKLYALIKKVDQMKTEIGEMVTSVQVLDHSIQSEWATSKLFWVDGALTDARNALYAIPEDIAS